MRGMTATVIRYLCIAIMGGTLLAGSVQAQLSSASVSTTGSTCTGGGSTEGDCQFSAAFLTNTGSQVSTRYAWNVNADAVSGQHDTSGTATHTVSFNATAPVGYKLTILQQRVGDLNRINDDVGCAGTADISGVTGASNVALTSGSLMFGDPGSIPNGGSTTEVDFNQFGAATIIGLSNGVPQAHMLTFTWNGSVSSNSCEVAVRMGESSGTTLNCPGCEYPGSPSRMQVGDGHFVTVLFTPLCGDGTVDTNAGEQCDQGMANGTAGSCCTATCQLRAAGETCRMSAGACDPQETCTGTSPTCPGDQKSTAVCRPSAGVCDLTETCDGINNNCPADAKSTSVCRASAGVCDLAESCDGIGNNCPADAKSTAQCRASAGVCDVGESCDGVGNNCPADAKSTAQCRASAGVCDVAESCDGVNDDCPTDAFEP